jgi:hypothetical protein
MRRAEIAAGQPAVFFDVMDTLVHNPFYQEIPAFFGMSLDELRRVKGVGEAVVDAIRPYVTFSQQPRQSRENEVGGGAARRLEKRRKRQSPSQ